ncbi:MAG: TRAP transporter large permease [Alphaproteobacteria bacterium]|nr:TRAP transporter large permease [Alphaproteobacteria bacterium]
MMLAILMVLLVLFIFLGMEIAWAIGAACLAYMILSLGTDNPVNFVLLSHQALDGIDNFALLAIPLFIFAGELMAETGVTQRLVRFAASWVGHIRGGLANVAVTSNFIMAGVSGSAIADAAATGTVLIPEMVKRKYPPTFAAAVIAASSTVGPIIPPSIAFVLLGAIVNISVGRLFLGGVIPGCLMSAAMFGLTWWIARRRGFAVEPQASWGERGMALLSAALPLAAPIIVMRAMVIGVATPTEAAAVLVAYILFLGFVIYRTLTPATLLRCAGNAALVTCIIMLTVGTAQMFSWLSVQEQFGQILTRGMLAVTTDPYVLLLLLNVVLLFLGTFMEPLPLMLVMGPIIFPLFGSMGVDPVHLGVVMVINLILGLITPPVGLILNVVGVIARADPMEVFWECLPYMAVLILVLLAVTYIPAITLWLPNLLLPSS